MVKLNGTYYTISEIAKELGITRQRLHIIAKKQGIKPVVVAKNFSLYHADEVFKIAQIFDA